MSLWGSYLKWRHSKGFGIHSPYAYKFVTDVLRPGHYSYYSYHEIEKHLKKDERNKYCFHNLIKFTIRLAIFLKAKRIVAEKSVSRLSEIVSKSLNLKDIRIINSNNFDFEEGDLLILDKGDINQDIIKQGLEKSVPVFALNPDKEIKEILERPLQRGLFFKAKKRLLLIPRQEMAYVAYDILLI